MIAIVEEPDDGRRNIVVGVVEEGVVTVTAHKSCFNLFGASQNLWEPSANNGGREEITPTSTPNMNF